MEERDLFGATGGMSEVSRVMNDNSLDENARVAEDYLFSKQVKPSKFYIMDTTVFTSPRRFKQIVGYRHLDELQQKLNRFSFRVTKDECLDLPDKVFVRREIELTKEQTTYYNQMKLMVRYIFS